MLDENKQYHPFGTKISLQDGVNKPIQDLVIGDKVITYNCPLSYFQGVRNRGKEVVDVFSREYIGDFMDIATSKNRHYCTIEHKCLTRLNGSNKHCLYLMFRGEMVKLGICKLRDFGIHVATQIKADCVWMLEIFANKQDAKIAEIMNNVEFKLPQVVLKEKEVEACLKKFGKMREFPLWERGKAAISNKKAFLTEAVNLISDAFEVRTYDGTPRGGAWEYAEVKQVMAKCQATSIEVAPMEDGRKVYVAGGIVTHC